MDDILPCTTKCAILLQSAINGGLFMETGVKFGDQEAISCSIIYRTAGLPRALEFLRGLLGEDIRVERINLLCTSKDFEIFSSVRT